MIRNTWLYFIKQLSLIFSLIYGTFIITGDNPIIKLLILLSIQIILLIILTIIDNYLLKEKEAGE